MPEVQTIIADLDFKYEAKILNQAKEDLKTLDKLIEDLKKKAILDGSANNVRKLSSQIAGLQKEHGLLSSAIDKVENSQGKASATLGKFTGTASQALNVFKNLVPAIAAVSFAKFISDSVAAAARLEALALNFNNFIGNLEKSKQLVEELDNLSASLPYSDDQVLQAGQDLLKYGIAADNVKNVIEQLSAVSIATNVSLNTLTDILGRANATGKVFGRDFQFVLKQVPGIVEDIAQQTGKTEAQVIKLGKSGKLSFEDFKKGIDAASASGGRFGQALENYRNSTESLQKRLREIGGDIQESFGGGFIDGFKKGLKELLGDTTVLNDLFRTIGGVLGELLTFLIGIGKEIGGFVSSLLGLDKVSFFRNAQGEFINFSAYIGAFLDTVRFTINTIFNLIGEIPDRFSLAILRSIGKLENIFGGISSGTQKLIEEYQSKIAKTTENLSIPLSQVLGVFVQRRLAEAKKAGEDTGKTLGKSVGEGFGDGFSEGAGTSIKDTINKLRNEIFDLKILTDPKNAVINETAKSLFNSQLLLDATTKQLNDYVNKFGDKASPEFVALLSEKIRLLTVQIKQTTGSIIRDQLNISQIPSVQFPLNLRVSDGASKELLDSLIEDAKKQTDALSEKTKQIFNNSFLNNISVRLFGTRGLFTPEEEDVFNNQLNSIVESAKDAYRVFSEIEIEKTNLLISESEKRISELEAIQGKANSRQIELEKKRLNELLNERDKAAKRQREIAAIEVVAANSVTAAESISAIAKAFSQGGVAGIATGIATSLALVATIVSTIASVQGALGGISGFYEGVERVDRVSKPFFNRSKDQHIIAVHGNERIFGSEQSKLIPENISNDLAIAYMMRGMNMDRLDIKIDPGKNSDSILGKKIDKSNQLLERIAKKELKVSLSKSRSKAHDPSEDYRLNALRR